MPSNTVYKSSSINTKNTGSVYLFNNLPLSFGATRVLFHCVSASNITNPATISIGTNSPTYDNIFAAQPIPGLVNEKEYISFPLDSQMLNDVLPNTQFYANISQAVEGDAQAITINIEGEPL